MEMRVEFYRTVHGRNPVEDEIDSLPKQAAAHAYQLLEEIEKRGFDATRVTFRLIRGKLWEIKMKLPGIGGYRVFSFSLEKERILLLHAFLKKTQKAPQRHVETALKRMADVLERRRK
jgi:phage-related protein